MRISVSSRCENQGSFGNKNKGQAWPDVFSALHLWLVGKAAGTRPALLTPPDLCAKAKRGHRSFLGPRVVPAPRGPAVLFLGWTPPATLATGAEGIQPGSGIEK